jgi:hypothetical protein
VAARVTPINSAKKSFHERNTRLIGYSRGIAILFG